MNLPLTAIVLTSAFLVSCSGSQKDSKDELKKKSDQVAASMNVSPGRCRIVGTVVTVSAVRNEDPSSPCGMEPCVATVRIDSVLGYGSGFSGRLVEGNTVVMDFAFTLGPTTEKLFPNMDARYPGLTVGSAFEADIAAAQAVAGSSPSSPYRVFEYTKIR